MNGLAGSGGKVKNDVVFKPNTRVVSRRSSDNFLVKMKSVLGAISNPQGGFSGLYQAAANSLYKNWNGIGEVIYSVDGCDVGLEMTELNENSMAEAEEAVTQEVRKVYGRHTDGKDINIAADLTVWLGPTTQLDVRSGPVSDKITALRLEYNNQILGNLRRVLKENDAEFRLYLKPGNIPAYDRLITFLESPRTDLSILKNKRDFLKLWKESGLPPISGAKAIPPGSNCEAFKTVGGYYTLFNQKNSVATIGTAKTWGADALNNSESKLKGFLNRKQFARRTARKISRFTTKVRRLFGNKKVRGPTEVLTKFADLDKNAASIENGYVKDFTPGKSAVASVSLARANSEEAQMCAEYERDPLFILEAIKHCYADLDEAFVGEGANNPSIQRAALDKAYASLLELWIEQKPDAFRDDNEQEGLTAFLVDRLAYAVPNAVTKEEFRNFIVSKGLLVDEKKLKQAAFIQKQLTRRRRSVEDTRTMLEKYWDKTPLPANLLA